MPYNPSNENAKGRRIWDIATQEQKVWDMEMEIVAFVIHS